MNDPIAGWRAEHDNFSRLLDVFEREVMRFHSGDAPDYELMLDILLYLRHFPERTHHPREDVAFERLVAYDSSLQPVVNRLLQEHRVIAVEGARVRDLLEAVVADSFVERAQVEAACASFLLYYRHHITAEDTKIMPQAAQMLTAEDWHAVGKAVSSVRDPLFGEQVDERYRELRRKIEAEVSA